MTREQILQAAEQLPSLELDALVGDFVRLSASRQEHRLPKRETELFARINHSVEEQTWERYQQLVMLQNDRGLTEQERAEFLSIGDLLEVTNSNRMDALAELAILRGVTLRKLMQELGIAGPRDAG